MARFFCRFLSRFWRGARWFKWRTKLLILRQKVYLNGVSLCESIASSAVAVVVSIDAFQPLHLLHNLHCVLLDQSLVREHILLLGAAVQVCARQDVRNCSESAEKHVSLASIFRLFICGHLWNSMAMNWITTMAKKKNTRTIPMGSRCKYSLVTMIWGSVNSLNKK